jgi:exodeoxyribonuclease VII large subunit
VTLCGERTAGLGARLDRAARALEERRRDRLEGLWKLVRSLSHEGVLDRGYTLALDADGAPVRGAAAVSAGQSLRLVFADGDVAVTADGGAGPREVKPGPKPRKAAGPPQADLFG